MPTEEKEFSSDANPRLSPLLRAFTAVVTFVLIAGGSLFYAPTLIGPRWPWALTPFNTRFLGGFYLAELAMIATLMIVNRWSPARLVLPLAFIFTLIVSAVSFLYFDRFDPQCRATWLWFVLYVGSALIAGYFLWRYRRLTPTNATPHSRPWRGWLLTQSGILGLYGLGLLLLPSFFSAFWPWRLDVFHAQVYSAIFITAAAGSYIVARVAAPIEFLTLGLGFMILGASSVSGLIMVDSAVHRVNWSLPGTWLWAGIFSALFLSGAMMVRGAYVKYTQAKR